MFLNKTLLHFTKFQFMKTILSAGVILLISIGLQAQVVEQRVQFSSGGGSMPNLPVSIGEPFGGSNNGFTIGSQQGVPVAVDACAGVNITIDANVNNASCGTANGSISVAPSGGTAPYTYSWNNGSTNSSISGLSAGVYSVIITDANGCSEASSNYSISSGASIAIPNETVTDITCNGGSNGLISITPTGGSAPYTYVWSNGQTNSTIGGLTAGSYTVVVADNDGCSQTFSYTISEPTPIAVNNANINNITCNGLSNGFINVTATGGSAPYTYTWSSGQSGQTLTNLNVGNYTLIITDGNACTQSIAYTITQPNPLVAQVTATMGDLEATAQNEGSININVNGGTPPYTYFWGNGATTQNLTGVPFGDYTCNITDANSCTTTIGPITVDLITDVEEVSHDKERVFFFPNPVEETFNVQITGSDRANDFTVVIYDAIGREMLRRQHIESTAEFTLGSLASGTYNVTVLSNQNEFIFSQQIVKK